MCHTHLIQLPWEEGGVYVPHPPDPALCDVEVPAGTAPLSGERDHTLWIIQIITTSAGIFKQSMGARNQVGIGLPYRPAGLHSLAELVP